MNTKRVWSNASAAFLNTAFPSAAFPLATLILAAVILFTGCRSLLPADKNHPLEFAYVGPATATLRQDLAARSDTVTTVKHGERLEIIDTRRRLVRVKAADGATGWIDANLLLTQEQMQELTRISALAGALPSQGKANVSDALNGHTEPYRQAPSLFQVPENGKVEVLAHRIAARVGRTSPVAVALQPKPVPKPAVKSKKGKREEAAAPIAPAAANANTGNTKEPAAPPVFEDWSLVRSEDGQAGWALSRMLYMEIPDEVIRYTGGNRVTAYLDLGEVEDEGRNKHNWVWTTTSGRGKPYDFDSFRVLIWNPVKHRYETALAEHDLEGHYPLRALGEPVLQAATMPPTSEAGPASGSASPSTPVQDSVKPVPPKNLYDPVRGRRFSLAVKDQRDGQTYLRSYELLGRRVKLLAKVAIAAAPEVEAQTTGAASRAGLATHIADQTHNPTPNQTHNQTHNDATSETPNSHAGWWDRAKSWLGK